MGVSAVGSNHGTLQLFLRVMQYFHKVLGNKSQSLDLNSTPNKKSETTANCVTQTLKSHGLVKCIAVSGDNTNTNFGGISCSGNKNVLHV